VPHDEPIRILRVIARLNVGGPALHVSHLSRELDRIGYETTLVAGRVDEHEGSMEYVARELGVSPEYVPYLQREISPLADAVAVAAVLRLIRRHRPHILHTHTAKAGAVGRLAAVLAGPARPQVVIHTFHGHVLRGYFSPLKTAGFRQLERQLARVSDALIAVSPEVRDDLVALGVAPAEKISVVRLGLPLESRAAADPDARARIRAELGIPEDRFTAGWLGRMTEIKLCDDLLRAFAELRSGGVDADLLLAGDGPLRESLERLAGELGIASRCHFVGYRDDVGDVYAAIDAFALTSANEGTPVVAIEALAARRPVVSTDVGGVRDVVVDGRSGFLVPPGDVSGIADGLARLAADPAMRSAFGEEGRAFVLDRYSIPRLVTDLDRLYRSLLEREPEPVRRPRRSPPAALTPAIPPDRLPGPAPKTLRVLLLSQYFPPEVGATQSRMQSFAEYLAARGHEVTVVSEFPNHPQGVIPPEYRGRLIEDDRSNPYRVLRVWVKASEEKTQATRIAFYLSYMALATAVAPLVGRVDVVLATSPPLFTGVAGLAIARLKRAAFVLDVRDLWPAAAISLLQISAGHELRAAEALERLLYRDAAAVVAVTEPFCDHVDAIRGRPPRTALVPNGTLERFFDEGDVERLAPDDRFLVTFAGTLGIAQALPSVLDAAERLDGSVQFAFVGDGPIRESLVADAERRRLDNVSFHEQRPLEEIPPILHGSDALLVTLSGHPTFADFVPSKLIDCMAAGRPVILSAAGEAVRLLERAGAGVVVAPEDPDALADAVRRLAAHPEEARAMGERGRSFAGKRLRSVQAARLEQVLLDAVERR
jgi:glycosyltransferase involved in cell wall biosynthesis